MGVPRIVDADPGGAGLVYQVVEGPLEVPRFERFPVGSAEDETLVMVLLLEQGALADLLVPVSLQGLGQHRRQGNRADARLSLGFLEHEPASGRH